MFIGKENRDDCSISQDLKYSGKEKAGQHGAVRPCCPAAIKLLSYEGAPFGEPLF